MSNWATAADMGELVKRAKTLLHRQGRDHNRAVTKLIRSAEFHGIRIKHHLHGRVTVEDQVAGVLTFNFKTEGIGECFGGTALNVLKTLRENMVLDDLADA